MSNLDLFVYALLLKISILHVFLMGVQYLIGLQNTYVQGMCFVTRKLRLGGGGCLVAYTIDLLKASHWLTKISG